MPVQMQDITLHYTGGLDNQTGVKSIGGAKSIYTVINGVGKLFDNILGTDHASGKVDVNKVYDYRVIALKIANNLADSSSDTLTDGKLLVVDSDLGDSDLQAFVADEVNIPFTAAIDENTSPLYKNGNVLYSSIPELGLDIPELGPGDEVHIAFRRNVDKGSTIETNKIQLQITAEN